MMMIRYSALFEPSNVSPYFTELALSLSTLRHFVIPYVNAKICVYILSQYREQYERILLVLNINCELIEVDKTENFDADTAFANSIKDCEAVDRICIRRMLTDFRLLDVSSYRLLIGCDVFFLAPPDEILQAYWSPNTNVKVLYMADTSTFRGIPYELTYFHGKILSGLLGDFYLLSPGVTLSEKAIKGCLNLIDSWPSADRYMPRIDCRTNQSEQQTAAILLQPFGGEMLRPARYSHCLAGPDVAVLHTHVLNDVIPRVPPQAMDLFGRVLQAAS